MNSSITQILFSLILFFIMISCSKPHDENNYSDKKETNKDSILIEMKRLLDDDFSLWYPLTLDTLFGGFFSDINHKWELDGLQNKMIVSQARHVWSTANAAMFFENKIKYLKIAEHGFKFLRDVMWDNEYGGFL